MLRNYNDFPAAPANRGKVPQRPRRWGFRKSLPRNRAKAASTATVERIPPTSSCPNQNVHDGSGRRKEPPPESIVQSARVRASRPEFTCHGIEVVLKWASRKPYRCGMHEALTCPR